MSLEKRLVFGKSARDGILKGILKCKAAVQSTFGPRGNLYVVWKGSSPYSSRDGMKCLQSITFSDELENIGASLIKEASTKANLRNGDGSTTVALLTAALCHEANKLMNQGMDHNEVIAGFRLALDEVLESIQKMVKPGSDPETMRRVAKVSAHGDDQIADVVLKAFQGLGEYGIVSVANSLSRSGKSDVVFSTGSTSMRASCLG